ncbi:MAG TPA: HprK-related kinase A [Gammaproteobacteria bacterium]|nr:HprK-related kinase A [Gammaproteobacteria bacterium]
MRLSELPVAELRRRLAGPGLALRTGPVTVRIQTTLTQVMEGLAVLYADHPVADVEQFLDFHIRLARPSGPRRWFKPQVCFYLDGRSPFKPLPLSQAFPMLEWGLNWCMASFMHQYLLLHAAVVERNGIAVILPGAPGAGKSTLCAALVGRGWRLFSDEMAIVSLEDGRLVPNPRPIGLKNESIDVIRRFAPEGVMGTACVDTRKGTVAHMKPPRDSVRRAGEGAPARFVVAPRYLPGGRGRLEAEGRAAMLMTLVENAFNYNVVGKAGFTRLADLIDACECYRFEYDDLPGAVEVFDALSGKGS